uniref:inorganic diphosphatase n=1 Tax=Oryza brachyantha TaxID=4533 RepID=J3LHG3_ORYBR
MFCLPSEGTLVPPSSTMVGNLTQSMEASFYSIILRPFKSSIKNISRTRTGLRYFLRDLKRTDALRYARLERYLKIRYEVFKKKLWELNGPYSSDCRRVLTTTALLRTAELRPKEQGLPETLDYRVFLVDGGGRKVSPWHDVPLRAGDGVFHFVVEIPKESSAKMEVATDESFTPIKQDTKKGNLRYYPYNINWNYGLFPQTWEDPTFANTDVEGALGDNDPVDVVEIGERRANIGDVLKVKPLAALAMIDEGELDWKIVAISLDDPKASLVNDVDDVEKHFPGTLTAIRDWFRDYKIPDGKPANRFGLGNKPTSKEYALKVIQETNESWEKLVKRNIPAGELSLA